MSPTLILIHGFGTMLLTTGFEKMSTPVVEMSTPHWPYGPTLDGPSYTKHFLDNCGQWPFTPTHDPNQPKFLLTMYHSFFYLICCWIPFFLHIQKHIFCNVSVLSRKYSRRGPHCKLYITKIKEQHCTKLQLFMDFDKCNVTPID